MDLLKINRHWYSGFRYNFSQSRQYLDDLIQHIDKPQITELTGLRRTGKTTLLLQTINHLLNNNINPYKIWYFTFDIEVRDIDKLFNEFEIATGCSLQRDKIYVFMDEIQKLGNFESQIKVFYDLYPNIKFFISGSTSLFIKKKSRESLAGRVIPLFLPILSFREFLVFSGKPDLVEKPGIFWQDLEKEYEKYWGCQLIETVGMKNVADRKEYYESILKKIIFEDIPAIESVEYPDILFRLARMLANYPGMYLNYDHIANDLKISSRTISKYFTLLEDAFIIDIVYNYSKNQLVTEKRLKRAYLSAVSFTKALSDHTETGMLAENAILSVNKFRFFWRDAYQHEIDFIDVSDDKVIPVEVKYKYEPKPGDLQNLFLFSRKYKISQAICLAKGMNLQRIDYKGLDVIMKSIYLFDRSHLILTGENI